MKFVVIQLAFCIIFLANLCQSRSSVSKKIFNYAGSMPIKEERSETTLAPEQDMNSTSNAEQEAACWKLIHEQSIVTFALQERVLNEFQQDLKNLTLNEGISSFIEKTTLRMRKNMADAKKALEKDAADEFFDALFDTSEDIISLSSILREPHLNDETFMVFVKAVSRLGRNNANLIQEFADMCSFIQNRGPKPRIA